LKKSFKYYRINYQISAANLRLLDESGKQIGVKTREEALKMAQAEGKDLVEIAGKANPPVVRIIDYKKFKYLEAKRERDAKKKTKNVTVKEIRLSPFIGEHDFQTRIKKAEEFLKEGNQLKINLPFRGREIVHKEFGMETMKKAIQELKESAKVIRDPHFEGRVLVAQLAPAKGSI